jgi:hypothetical protein
MVVVVRVGVEDGVTSMVVAAVVPVVASPAVEALRVVEVDAGTTNPSVLGEVVLARCLVITMQTPEGLCIRAGISPVVRLHRAASVGFKRMRRERVGVVDGGSDPCHCGVR